MKDSMTLSKLERLVEKRNLTPAQLHAVIDRLQTQEYVEHRVKHHWGARHVRFGLLGDTHIGSRYADYGVLNDLFKRFKAEGAECVYHAGDITEGYGRRKGHTFECDLHGVDEQVAGVVERFPDVGLKTFFITGDHDRWHFDSAGVDIGKMISEKRKDLKYLGPDAATIELTKDATIELLHPATGTAYAISYKPQKIAEAMSGGEKPAILAIGHFHKIEYLFYRSIHIFQTGTTERQTNWMRRMNISAHLGGWLLDVHFRRNAQIDRVDMKLFPYYS